MRYVIMLLLYPLTLLALVLSIIFCLCMVWALLTHPATPDSRKMIVLYLIILALSCFGLYRAVCNIIGLPAAPALAITAEDMLRDGILDPVAMVFSLSVILIFLHATGTNQALLYYPTTDIFGVSQQPYRKVERGDSIMKVKDFIAQDVDMDVYDDVCEELGVAFVGPMQLTDEGKAEFAEVLEFDMEMVDGNAIVKIDAPVEAVWQRRLSLAKEFFEAAAGYCAHDDYDKWFKP